MMLLEKMYIILVVRKDVDIKDLEDKIPHITKLDTLSY